VYIRTTKYFLLSNYYNNLGRLTQARGRKLRRDITRVRTSSQVPTLRVLLASALVLLATQKERDEESCFTRAYVELSPNPRFLRVLGLHVMLGDVQSLVNLLGNGSNVSAQFVLDLVH